MDDGLNGVDSVRRMSLMLSDNDLEGNLASTIVTILEHSCSSYNFTCSLVIETFVSLIFSEQKVLLLKFIHTTQKFNFNGDISRSYPISGNSVLFLVPVMVILCGCAVSTFTGKQARIVRLIFYLVIPRFDELSLDRSKHKYCT